MRLILCILLVVVTFVSATFRVVAQTDTPKCETADIIAQAAALKPGKDNLSNLIKLRKLIRREGISCGGISVSGKGERVFEPYDLPGGLYEIGFSGNGWLSGKAMSGQCGQSSSSNTVFQIMLTKERSIDERLVTAKNCRLMIEVSLSSGAWTMTMEKVDE